MWHGFFPLLSWKQSDRLIALPIKESDMKQKVSWVRTMELPFVTIKNKKYVIGCHIVREVPVLSYIMLIDAAMVYPTAIPNRFTY